MQKLKYIIAFLTIACLTIGCAGNENTSSEPDVERILAPESEEQIDPVEDPVSAFGLEELRDHLEQDPTDLNARFSYLVGLDSAEEYMLALEQAEIIGGIEEDNPYRAVAWMNYANIVNDHPGSLVGDRDTLVNMAIEGLNICLDLEPSNIPAHIELGKLLRDNGDSESALHHFAIALAGGEIGYEIRTWMAKQYISQGDFFKARSHLEKALALAEAEGDPESAAEINSLLSELD
ncbi:MAG TPA: tetratricopeptide repeat protein [bacterium]|jgi:tetratricopeptide (TPR) repeat protein